MEYKVICVFQKAKANCCEPEPPSLINEIQKACSEATAADYVLITMSWAGSEVILIFGRKR
jgi:hypothetical protein